MPCGTILSATSLSIPLFLCAPCAPRAAAGSGAHPLQCRALELYFSVALDRLPAAAHAAAQAAGPPVSNALVAALKRAQAQQRRGCPEATQQPLLAVQVELEQLVLSVLDDPAVSRVMSEAAFSVAAVKTAIEQSLASPSPSPSAVVSTPKVAATKPLATPSAVPTLKLAMKPVIKPLPLAWLAPQGVRPANAYINPRLAAAAGGGDDASKVLDVMLRPARHNPVLVGDAGPDAVLKEALRRIPMASSAALAGAKVLPLEGELAKLAGDKAAMAARIGDLGAVVKRLLTDHGAVVLDLGDLKWLVDGPAAAASEGAKAVVSEMARLLRRFGNSKVWAVGTAACATYLRCKVYHPTMEAEWDLQAVPIARSAPLVGAALSKSGNGEGTPAEPVGDADRSLQAEPDNGEGTPAGPVGEAERSLKAEPACDPQVGACSASIRRLFEQLVCVRTTMSSFSGKLPSDAWFNHVKHLTSDAEESLEHLHYKMMLVKLGVETQLKKVMPDVSETCSKTTATSFMHLLASQEFVILQVTDKLEGLRHGSPGLSGAGLGYYRDMMSLSSSVMRCILLCRGILGIINMVNTEGKKESLELPVFSFDDLTYAGQNKRIGTNANSVPGRMTDPIYLSSMFIRSLLCLDLSSCSGLTQLPPSIGNLSNLAALNLSHCYSLHTLTMSIGSLKNLQILFLSWCHELRNLPVSLCELSKLRLLDLAGCSSLENLPASLVNLGNLENLNLSYCKGLKELPQPFGNLQELKYLNLSGSHHVELDVECIYTLRNLKSLTLSPLTNIQGFPVSFNDLANHLDSLRWWKKNQIQPQCVPKAASLHSYRCHEQSIIDILLSDEADNSSDQIVTYACIVGESGMGKTELAQRIYNNQMILDTFDLRIWLHMCDKKRLLGKIVELTTCASCSDASVSVLEEIVIEELTRKRLLLVLDDSEIKNQYFWGYLRKLLNVCAKGSAVIVTTKSKEVAKQIGEMQTFYLSPLSKEECFMIFKEHVPEKLIMNNYCQLESIGWKFVEKCGGNPMCIKALSGLLCHSEVGLSEIDMIIDGILPALRLCYDLLPAYLQQCFKFCSLFPKDYIFDKHHIIRLWIAEGFVFCEDGTKPEDTALHYFDQIFCRSFFQRSPFHSDHKDSFVMHELFHDLADSVSKNECFRCEEPFCSLAENVSHQSLVLSDFKTAALSNEVRNLQSFLVVRRCFPVVRIFTLDDIFVKHRFLRALNLSYTDILELPISIGNMKQLRLLALNYTKIKSLPSEIGQVNSLQTLELKDCCHLIDLPGSTSNLVKLRHLDVQKESGNVNVGMPHGIGHLTDLQTLTTFNIGNDLLHCSISELKYLNGLRGHVHVTGLENIKTANDAREANMMGKHLLEALTLEWFYWEEDMDDDMGTEIANEILQNLQPNSNIMELVIRNYAGNLFPVWMQGNYLCKLISVTLDNCHGCSDLPYLGDLPSLKSLFIQRINAVERFGIETSSLATEDKHPTGFPSLEVLNICEMYDLQFWVGTREEDFPRLLRLSISRCPKLTNLPRLVSLVHVSFYYGVELPTFSELPSLESLTIQGFQKIRSISFPHQLTTLKKLEIIDCKELLSIYAYSLSVSDLKVVRCLKLDLVGSSMEDHIDQKVVSGRNRHIVLKTLTYTNLLADDSNWEKFGEKNIFGYIFTRSYYRCIWRNSTGCSATKILQPDNNDPNTLFVMYISEHNHGLSNEPDRKRKEYDVSSDENTSKKQRHDSFVSASSTMTRPATGDATSASTDETKAKKMDRTRKRNPLVFGPEWSNT